MARLGDVCDILNGFAFKSEQYVEEGIRIIRIANVQKGYIEDSTPVFYPYNSREAQKYRLEEGDMLMSLTGNVGRVAKLSKEFLPAALNQRVACLRIKDGVSLSKAFLFNLLDSDYFEQQCIAASKGVAQKNMSTEWLREYEIPLFPLEQQKAIASILDKISELISLRKEQLAKLDQLVKSRFIELFGDMAHKSDKVFLEELSDFVTVGIANSATHAYADDGIVMLRNQNIKENYLDDNDLIHITPEFAKKYGSKQLEENDILVIRTGYPGVACLVPKKYEGCQTFTTLIVRLKDASLAHANYVCHYINSRFGKDYVEQSKVGVAQQNFGAKALAKMPIVVPPMELQEQFATFVEQTDKSKLVIQQSLDKLELLKKSLMQEYFG